MSDEATPRRRWWPQTVRVRLTIIATLAFAITLSLAAFGLVRVVHTNLVDRIAETNQTQLDELQAAVRRGDLQPPPVRECYQVPGGYLCSQAHPDRSGVEAAQREIQTTAGNITLVAQQSTAAVNRTVHSVTNVLLVVVPVMILLVALAAWYFTGRALRPVEAIRREAEEITGATMDRRVPEPETDDEVGRLARTMNAMLDRLESSSQRQRQFVSDASHELRSPLASIRTNLEVALRHADRADWPAVAGRALAEDARMEDTVSELLELARLDEVAGPAPLDTLPDVDLDELVLDDTVQERRVPVDTSRVSAGRVHGRREQLTRVVRNLLDNAARHATSSVAVELRAGDDHTIELTVDDDGPGIPVDDRERVFDRFTRLDDGRARDAGGLGLGLSMVKEITEQHGGTVTVEDAPSGGARLRVRLPAA
ncbi:MAG TPA: HAMP domain-containing sensor histidine kinase [Acidimicrobiia bacterium]|jgi:signal transduction histidine kinase|nr:HAMP domain-containing sensor histidine kinase [Acidimicrobiia bacterium]